MELKHVVFFLALFLAVPLATALARKREWLRDACMLALVIGTTRFDLQAINFISREWYRGTTRGIEICWLDLLWLILLASDPAPIKKGSRLPRGLVPMLVFTAYNALNVLISTPHLFGVFELSKMIRALMLFWTVALFIKSERELRVVTWGIAGAVIYEWAATVHSRVVLYHPRADGTLAHPNAVSMYNLIFVPVLLAVGLSDVEPRLRRTCAVAAVLGTTSVVFTISRTGIAMMIVLLLLVGVTCGSFKVTAKKIGGAVAVAAVVGVALFLTWGDLSARFEDSDLEREYSGKVYEGRGAYINLAGMIVDEDFFGCGLNNWSYWVSNTYGAQAELHYIPYVGTDAPPPVAKLRKEAHVDSLQAPPAHSLYAITLGETGWPGVVLFGVVWLYWAHMTGSFFFKRSPAFLSRFGVGAFAGLVGAFGQSFSEWAFRETSILFAVHILLGAAAAAYPSRPSARPGLHVAKGGVKSSE
jgi:hypothetical protein